MDEIDPYGNHWYDFGQEIKSLWSAFIDYGYNTAANEAAIEDPGTNLSNFILDSNPEKDVSIPENDQLLVSFIGQLQLHLMLYFIIICNVISIICFFLLIFIYKQK